LMVDTFPLLFCVVCVAGGIPECMCVCVCVLAVGTASSIITKQSLLHPSLFAFGRNPQWRFCESSAAARKSKRL
jgi:hypothetical protein